MSKFLILAGIINLLLGSSQLQAADSFFGKYKMVVGSGPGADVYEFLLNSQDQLTLLKAKVYGNRQDLSMIQSSADRTYSLSDLGPSLPFLTLAFGHGSDEDTTTNYINIAWIGEEGSEVLTELSSMTLFRDGPNGMSEVYSNDATLYRWNKKTKKYVKVPEVKNSK